jgi:hypothetical protein
MYQFELYDLGTESSYARGAVDEAMPSGSVYKLFVIAAIVQMIDEGALQRNELLRLDPSLYRRGEGVLQQFSDLTHLSVVDCCKMVVATSDNVCADTLHALAGNQRIASMFAAAGCSRSRVTDNLDTLIGRLLAAPHRWSAPDYMYSSAMFENYESAIASVLPENHTTATDCNRMWRFLNATAYRPPARDLFFEIARTHNIHSRVSRYVNYCASPKMCGKTGSIGAGRVMNETNLIYDPHSKKPLGFFSFFSQHNREKYYAIYDVLACVGLELAKIYHVSADRHYGDKTEAYPT